MTPEFAAALSKTTVKPYRLVELLLDPADRLTSCFKDISWNGYVYKSSPNLMSIGDIQQNLTFNVGTVSIALSGVDQLYISRFLGEAATNRLVNVYQILLDENYELIPDPELIFSGSIDSVAMSDDSFSGTSTITVNVASLIANYEKKSGRRANHNDQQIHFPGDNGLEFAGQKLDDLEWGR